MNAAAAAEATADVLVDVASGPFGDHTRDFGGSNAERFYFFALHARAER